MATTGQKGRKFGGRAKGTPNKRTTERLEAERIAEQARAEVNKANAANRKLGKDMLEQYMMAFHGIAAVYQNQVATAAAKGDTIPSIALAGFKEWGELVVDTANKLAQYQSPRFKAIAVVAPPPQTPTGDPQKLVSDGKVYRIDDPVAISKVYSNLIRAVR